MDRVTASRGWTAFERLAPTARARLLPLGRESGHSLGDVILREGEDTPFLGAVDSGRVALRLRIPELGERVTIATIEPGELLGWSAVVAPFRTTVDAVATEPTRLLVLEAGAFRELLATDCELSAELLPLVLESLSRRLTTSWQQLLDLFATRTVEPW